MWYILFKALRHSMAKQRFNEQLRGKALLLYNLVARKRNMPIVVASTGRNGSTLLYKSIVSAMASNKIERLLFAQSMWNLKKSKNYRPNGVYKTHDLPTLVNGVRYVFIYGDPIESSVSVFRRTLIDGNSWLKLHCENLGYSGKKDLSVIFQKDILNYKEQMHQWCSIKNPNVLCLDINQLWADKKLLEVFLQVQLTLPTKRQRSENQEVGITPTLALLKDIYENTLNEMSRITSD